LEKQVEKLQENIKKNIKRSFSETPKLNSYFFQAHSLFCKHNATHFTFKIRAENHENNVVFPHPKI
jgi:hypothetical protein